MLSFKLTEESKVLHMVTDDKVKAGKQDVNVRDAKRVGIWFLVISGLTMIGLLQLGDSHAPAPITPESEKVLAEEKVNPDFDVNRSAGVIEWPGMVGKKTGYLSGKGNTPAVPSEQITGEEHSSEKPASPTAPAPAGH